MRKAGKTNDATPRRKAAAVAMVDDERNLVMRLLLHSPKDLIAAMFASAAVIAILTNAMFMQAGHHPSPMFGAYPATVSIVTLPRPRPIEAEPREAKAFEAKSVDASLLEPTATPLKPAEPKVAPSDPKPAVELQPVQTRSVEPKHVEPKRPLAHARAADADPDDAMANLVRSTAAPAASAPSSANAAIPRPPASIPAPSRDAVGAIGTSKRVASVQRALTEYGYGQLKPTGTVGADTQAAIQKFERARHLPVTGQMSDRLVRELAAVTGRAID